MHLLPHTSSRPCRPMLWFLPTLVVVSVRGKTWGAVLDPGQLQPAGRTGELPAPSDAMRQIFRGDRAVSMHRFSWRAGHGALLSGPVLFLLHLPILFRCFTPLRLHLSQRTHPGATTACPPFFSVRRLQLDPVGFPNRTRTISLSTTFVDPGRTHTCFLFFDWVEEATNPPPQISCKQSTTCTCACCTAFVGPNAVPLHLWNRNRRCGCDRWIRRNERRRAPALVG